MQLKMPCGQDLIIGRPSKICCFQFSVTSIKPSGNLILCQLIIQKEQFDYSVVTSRMIRLSCGNNNNYLEGTLNYFGVIFDYFGVIFNYQEGTLDIGYCFSDAYITSISIFLF